jgi:hypothetical protein
MTIDPKTLRDSIHEVGLPAFAPSFGSFGHDTMSSLEPTQQVLGPNASPEPRDPSPFNIEDTNQNDMLAHILKRVEELIIWKDRATVAFDNVIDQNRNLAKMVAILNGKVQDPPRRMGGMRGYHTRSRPGRVRAEARKDPTSQS